MPKIDKRLKAIRKGNREAEFEIFGPGFHTFHRIRKSKRLYDRKKLKVIDNDEI